MILPVRAMKSFFNDLKTEIPLIEVRGHRGVCINAGPLHDNVYLPIGFTMSILDLHLLLNDIWLLWYAPQNETNS